SRLAPLPLHDALPILAKAGSALGVAAWRLVRRDVVEVDELHDRGGGRHHPVQGAWCEDAVGYSNRPSGLQSDNIAIELSHLVNRDRKSTRLNSSHVKK